MRCSKGPVFSLLSLLLDLSLRSLSFDLDLCFLSDLWIDEEEATALGADILLWCLTFPTRVRRRFSGGVQNDPSALSMYEPFAFESCRCLVTRFEKMV